MSSSETEAERTNKVRNKGREHGLFRACMDQIRTSHTIGQTLRHAALAAGLLSDAKCYAELLGQFYVATAALERRMEELLLAGGAPDTNNGSTKNSSSLSILAKVNALGYSFSRGYERDLHALLGPEWKETIQSWTTEPARRYIRRLEAADDVECAAAAFILHGPLIIGGGAMIKPRVERLFGPDATNVFESVIGRARGGRSNRQREFIDLYDTLLDEEVPNKEFNTCIDGNSGDARFTAIVQACGEFMQLNNEIMLAVRQAPWWRKYVAATVAATASALIWRIVAYDRSAGQVTVSPTSTA